MFFGGTVPGILTIDVKNLTDEKITDIKIDYNKGSGSRSCYIKKIKARDNKRVAISTRGVDDERALRIVVGDSERVIIWEPITLNMTGCVTVKINGIDENGILNCTSEFK
ncbi:MAG: hypothetical protein ACRCTZ_20290 [Sarcina sp.]